eukprot:CAMPEP_0174726048 /NCGR_PEP_ID=MMETSP1094-20130205/46946_1 /TAXON_ID=156173 /ORGANISM="Chrysochromulina brevifilum, Strain UTEX LB 985" /LENGTH=141 /DNA_ID=CAMNT_0015927557 /DNA_START=173 /DNA_END=596 /DNA_ORIENTATION=+
MPQDRHGSEFACARLMALPMSSVFAFMPLRHMMRNMACSMDSGALRGSEGREASLKVKPPLASSEDRARGAIESFGAVRPAPHHPPAMWVVGQLPLELERLRLEALALLLPRWVDAPPDLPIELLDIYKPLVAHPHAVLVE